MTIFLLPLEKITLGLSNFYRTDSVFAWDKFIAYLRTNPRFGQQNIKEVERWLELALQEGLEEVASEEEALQEFASQVPAMVQFITWNETAQRENLLPFLQGITGVAAQA